MEAARELDAERVRQLEDELTAQKRATQAANNAAEAQKVALERAIVVHKEELRVMQDETEQCALCPSTAFLECTYRSGDPFDFAFTNTCCVVRSLARSMAAVCDSVCAFVALQIAK
jgi:hypothetical protein